MKGDLGFFGGGSLPRADELAFKHPDEKVRLRALWLFLAHSQITGDRVAKWLADPSPHVRAWAIRVAVEKFQDLPRFVPKLSELAAKDTSPIVRREIASALPKFSGEHRWELLAALVAHADDAADHNLPYLYWYALEPLAAEDPAQGAEAHRGRGRFHCCSSSPRGGSGRSARRRRSTCSRSRSRTRRPTQQRLAYLGGLQEATKGKRTAAMPKDWPKAFEALMKSPDADVRQPRDGARRHVRRQDRSRDAAQRRSPTRRRTPLSRTAALASLDRRAATPTACRSCKRSLTDPQLRDGRDPRAGVLRRPEDAGARSSRGTPTFNADEQARRARDARRRARLTRRS